MAPTFKPAGYNSVSPYFIVDGAQKLIDMLIAVFDAKETRRFDRPDGTIMHAEVKLDDSIIMLADASAEFPAIRQIIHVYVPNVDEIYTKAINYGCQSVEAPVQKDDPDRRGTFTDFAGNMWSVGTQV
ncbi:MAG TPA: VOC family protein [Chitinophagaceae bacterium]|nr:VOC family protein [Chitinophagaceae bacterium]